ncbi:hypothetical protein ACKC9G_08430 [Pokkaliibacter sp. CJK22405]|uniref:hypothetical protein n=1 Tax=Pokkaliibacter sp. CJK22405 TaxID=3384615 RepID=UPI0039846512
MIRLHKPKGNAEVTYCHFRWSAFAGKALNAAANAQYLGMKYEERKPAGAAR